MNSTTRRFLTPQGTTSDDWARTGLTNRYNNFGKYPNISFYRLGQFSSPTFSTPPQTRTSDRPIFKNSFDSENSGKLTRDSIAITLIFALEDPFNCYHIFGV